MSPHDSQQGLLDIARGSGPRGWLFAAMLAAGMVAGGSALYRLVNPPISIEAQTAGCDLQLGPCSFELRDGARVTLELSPRPLKPLSPLLVRATVFGISPDKLELDVNGVGMYMGYNRPQLRRDSEGVYSGRLVLPVCSDRLMSWDARLLIAVADDLVSAPFRFSTDAS